MSITAVIPVRKGSTRVINKNIRPFAGSSLLENKICQLKKIPEIEKIVVSTDGEEMLELASRLGVEGIRRPDEYCDEKTKNFNAVVQYIAEQEVKTDIMMWTPCVCPLVGSDRIREAIHKYEEISKNCEYDSVVSASLLKEYLFDENGCTANFSVNAHVPSQKLPNWHVITNGFFIAKRCDMIKWRFVYGPHPYLVEVNKWEAMDIDDEYDFVMAEKAFEYLGGTEHGKN